jgi:hypothetical protein
MLRSTERLKIYRHPGADPDDDFPIAEGRRRYLRPLRTRYATPDSPTEFDVRDRLPFEFAGDSPQHAGQRARRIEEDLAEHYDGLELIDEASNGTPEHEPTGVTTAEGPIEATEGTESTGSETESEADAEPTEASK